MAEKFAGLDPRRVAALTAELLKPLAGTLATPPLGDDNVFVALNAIAAALCPVFAGTDFDPRPFAFFRAALAQNLTQFAADRGMPCALPQWLDAPALDEDERTGS